MDTITKHGLPVLASVVLAVVAVSAFGFGGTKTETVVREVVKEIREEPNLGALSSPNIISQYLSVNDVRSWYGHTDSLNAASTTVCAFQGPAATSTATWAVKLDSSSTTASILQFGTGAFSTATTTRSGTDVAVGANAKAAAFASTTIIAPYGWVTVGMRGGTGTHTPTGACSAIFTEI